MQVSNNKIFYISIIFLTFGECFLGCIAYYIAYKKKNCLLYQADFDHQVICSQSTLLLISFIIFFPHLFCIAGKTPERFFIRSRDPWPLQNCGRALGWGDMKGSGMLGVL